MMNYVILISVIYALLAQKVGSFSEIDRRTLIARGCDDCGEVAAQSNKEKDILSSPPLDRSPRHECLDPFIVLARPRSVFSR